MKVIVGLGNPGAKYKATPHNIGFEAIDILARRWHARMALSQRERAEIGEVQRDEDRVLLVKPMTYMNLSGDSVAEIMRNRPTGIEDLFVISDDTNLDLGRVRIRGNGSHGGHNGLRSIIERLGGDGFARFRIGVRSPSGIDNLVEYVLRPRPPAEREILQSMAEVAADGAEYWLRTGTESTANRFNGYRLPAGAEGS